MRGSPHFSVLGVPVRVEPAFLLVAVLFAIGWEDLVLAAAWVVVLFTGVLVHEFGHALTYRAFGSPASIVLWGLGGLTYGAHQPRGRRVLVSLAGPMAGIVLLGLPAWWIADSGSVSDPRWAEVVDMVIFFNVFWSLVNLLPILPLDGGHIAQEAIGAVTGGDGVDLARYLSIVVAAAAGFWAWSTWDWSFGLLFGGLLAFLNISALKGARSSMPSGGAPTVGMPGLRSRGPTREVASAASTGDVGSRIVDGYRALDRGDATAAIAAADDVLASGGFPEVARVATELKAWALLRQRRADEASEVVDALRGRKVDRHLRAALAIDPGGAGASGIEALVDAFVFASDGPARVQAAGFVADRGLTGALTRAMLARGPDGLEQAIRLEDLLQRLGRLDEAEVARQVIFPEG